MIFLTSNARMHETAKSVGFLQREDAPELGAAPESLRRFLPPELINRMDEILTFSPLSMESLTGIARLQLAEVAERAGQLGITLTVTEDAVSAAAACRDTAQYGARPIRRFIIREVENPLSRMWLRGELHSGDCVEVSAENGVLRFMTKTAV
jgi:ATP-dependent Clp protease ATP-binding subunit ClpB